MTHAQKISNLEIDEVEKRLFTCIQNVPCTNLGSNVGYSGMSTYLHFLSIYAVIKQIYCNSCKSLDPTPLAYVALLTRHSVTY